MSIKFKRICAYLIDLLIVSMLVVMLGSINFLNPHLNKYAETYEAYNEYYQKLISENEIIDPSDLINEEYAGYIYDLSYYSISNMIIEVVVILLYFTLFPRFNNNQTIGKRLFKIRVVSLDKDRVPFWKHFVRALLLPIGTNIIFYNSVTWVLHIIIIFCFKGIPYIYADLTVTYILCLYCYADVLFSYFRKDNRTIHDLICHTKVVEAC